MTLLPLGALGVIVGMIVAAVATSYGTDRRFWPWPRGREWRHDASPLRLLRYVRAFISAHDARYDDPPAPRPLWVGVAMAALFCGLGLRDSAVPALLLVSLVEATLLILLLVIDLDQRLVPTSVVGLLVAVALASANLWPEVGLRDALLGGAVGFGGFTALVGLARLLFGAGALGLGDASLALAIGCVTGYPRVIGALVLGIVLGGLGAGMLLLLRRGGLRQAMPYGPFLIAATLYVLVHGNAVY